MSQEKNVSGKGYVIFLGTLLAIGAIATTGLLLAKKPLPGNETPSEGGDAASAELKEFAGKYFRGWPAGKKPELVLLFTGEQHNYENPCGCTEPQFGGLERRYNFFTELRKLGLKTVAMDLGDISFPGQLPEQVKLKYRTSMKALDLMGYDAIAVGQEEFRINLLEALASTVLQNNSRYAILGANILDKENYPGTSGSMIEDYRVIQPKNSELKIGVIATVGQSVIDAVAKIDREVKFGNNGAIVPETLKAMQEKKPDVRVLLYQGSEDEAKALANNIKEFDIILCRSKESEPAPAQRIGNSRIIFVGQKGRYVGVMALFRTPEGALDFRFDLVRLGTEFKTQKEFQATNAGVKLLEAYTKEVKDKDLLSKYPQVMHPMQAEFWNPADPQQFRFHPAYIGSDRCKSCHDAEWQTWSASRHAGALETLSEHPKASPPHNRQFDGECIVCHTTGFGYKTGFTDEKRTNHLKGVGCENCHGPGSLHASEPANKDYGKSMSPWKRKPEDTVKNKLVENRVFDLCFKCHDTDNDHDFKFDNRWKTIIHGPSVKKKAGVEK